MPIYEYRCEKCGVFDVMQKITEKPLRKCPTCKSKVAKQMSSTAFQLKGTGWYVTDYAGKGKGSAKEAPAEKSDAKPEASADAKKPAKESKSSDTSGSASTSTAAA